MGILRLKRQTSISSHLGVFVSTRPIASSRYAGRAEIPCCVVCIPTQRGIHRNSQIFRQTIPSHHSLSQAFRLDGYFAGRIGKLYHYNVPKSVGTNGHDDPGSWELELNPAGCDRLEEESDIFSLRPGSFGGTLSWYASPQSDEKHTDGMLARDAEWVLERCAKDKDRPFFLAVGFYRPHTP